MVAIIKLREAGYTDLTCFEKGGYHWLYPMLQAAYSGAMQAVLKTAPALQRYIRSFHLYYLESIFGEATLGNDKRQRKIQECCLRHLAK